MNKGICALSNIPVRKASNSASEMVSMLLFGEIYTVLEVDGNWTKINFDEDDYEGWINNKQVTPFNEPVDHMDVLNLFPFTVCQSESGIHYLLPGSQVMNAKGKKFVIQGQQYTVETLPETKTTSDIPALAQSFLNTPYLWGGRSVFGIDCSGLTQIVFKMAGVTLKRDAWQQATQGSTVAFRESVLPGDLAFFDNEEGKITHVGIMLSPGKIIHASGMVRIDEMDDFGIMNTGIREYSHKLRIIKRLF